MRPLRALWAAVGGRRAHARVGGLPGPPGLSPVVLVHGLAVSSRYMVPTAERLAPHRAVYAPDLPGFGLSPGPAAALDIAGLAAALLAWLDALGLERVALLGNSLGCQTIVELAARRPERVAALVLVGPTPDPRALSVAAHALRLARDLRHESLASIVTQGGDYLRCGPRRTLATLRHGLAHPLGRRLARVAAPALVVRGEHDPIAPQAWAEEVAALLPRGELRVIPGAPHALNYDCPAELAAATLDFLHRWGV